VRRIKIRYGILILAILVLLGSLLVMTGCPAPLNFSGVRNPNITLDGAGGAKVTYQINEGETRTTYVQRLEPQGEALWGKKGITLYSEPGPDEGVGVSALLVNSDDESTILVWEQTNSIWAQKLDTEGRFLWGSGNVRIADGTYKLKVASDSSGGVIMAWSDSYDNLYLQRIGSQGNLLWTIGSPVGQAGFFDISGDSSGNTFVIWEDKDFNVFVQKLDFIGELPWPPGGLLISDVHGPGVGMNSIISDGAGGAIAAWIYEIRDERKIGMTGHELYAQRISAEGKTIWKTGGVPIRILLQEQRNTMPYEPQMVSDDSGGAFILWKEHMSIYAQRIDTTGKSLWAQSGIEVWEGGGSPRSPYFSVENDCCGGAIVVWNYIEKGKRSDQSPDLCAQRLDVSGRKLWSDNGILVTTTSQGYLTPALISPDGYGGAIFSWAAGKNMHNAGSSYVQRISAEGNPLWGEEGIRLDP